MAYKKYDKLVRDGIPRIIYEGGQVARHERLDTESCLEYLAAKLSEEANEYIESRELEELADVVEVVRGILHHSGRTWDELEQLRARKYEERGGFENGIKLIGVES